jgi:drug/metabolite transporter (DMT)-like permease
MSLHQSSGRQGLGFLLAGITMLVWSALPLSLELLLARMDPGSIVWVRFCAASVFLGLLLAQRGELPRLSNLARADWLLLLLATAGLATNYVFYMLGLHYTSAATSQVLIQVGPLFLALGGIVVFREHFSRLQWIGFSVLVAGIAAFCTSQLAGVPADPADSARFALGIGFIAAAAFTWAIFGVAQKQLLTALPSQGLMLCLYVGCTIALAPAASPASVLELDTPGWLALGFAILATLVAYGCFAASLEHVEASRVSAIIALVPIGTFAFAAIAQRASPATFSAEFVAPVGYVGAGAVVFGSLLTALGGDASTTASRRDANHST